MGRIEENVKRLLSEIPSTVKVVAATKSRTLEEVEEALKAGIGICGENYLQEAEPKIRNCSVKCEWHYIGSLQKRKIRRIVELFDVIQTVDSVAHALEIDKWAMVIGKKVPVMFEVNIGEEPQKAGFLLKDVKRALFECSKLRNLVIVGLMTMGPLLSDVEEYRPYFAKMRKLYEEIAIEKIENVSMRYLSMGMSDSFRVAIEEGANMVRIGTAIFGPRNYKR